MIPRELEAKLMQKAKKLPVVLLTGPRQSGKTTLAKHAFPEKPYVSLEDLDTADFARNDPRGFLSNYPKGAVLDEVQRVPEILSYIQGVVDAKDKAGMFILTGSQQLLLHHHVSQTLAGRVGILNLLPFSIEELLVTPYNKLSLDDFLLRGMYPRIYAKKISPGDWYPEYIKTYIERDLRQLKAVGDVHTFQRFLKLCAARTGQLLNLSSLANDCGITHNTVKSWLGVLVASFIAYVLPPHHRNFRKRMVKAPKLHFYDTGLVCSLLGVTNRSQLEIHPLRGNLFETFVVSELMKYRCNRGLPENLYFWRDKTGHEIDCIMEDGTDLTLVEIKSAQTIAGDFFRNLDYWSGISGATRAKRVVIYGGEQFQKRSGVTVVGWKNIADCLRKGI